MNMELDAPPGGNSNSWFIFIECWPYLPCGISSYIMEGE